MKRVLSLVVLGVVALVASGARADAPREKAKFKTDDGNVVYELKKEDDGAKLVDGHEGLLARIHDKDGGLKVKGPNGEEVARLKLENGAWKIEDAAHKLQHRLESAPGQLLLKDANGAVEATIAFDATHAEVKAGGASAGQVQLAKGKLRLTGAQAFWTKAALPPEAVAAFALPALGLPERAALVYALSGKKL